MSNISRNTRKVSSFIAAVILLFGCSILCFSQSSAQAPTSQADGQQAQPGPSLQRRPSSGSNQAQAPAQAQVSPAEVQAYTAIQKETDPEKQLQLVKDFQQKFPQSKLMSNVLFFGAGAAEEKNDVPDALNYGQESLKLEPNNLRSLILVASLLPLPQALPSAADQKQQQLGQSESDANRALQLLSGVQPPPTASQAQLSQFDRGKKMIEAQLHASLGMAHLEKAVLVPAPKAADPNELSAAEQEFKTAVSGPQPNPQDFYRLGEVYTRENKLDEAIGAFGQAAHLGQGTVMEKLASAKVAELQAQKAKSQPPAKNTPQQQPNGPQ